MLEGLIEEDDRVPDAWHLLALSYYSGHQYEEAVAVLAKGKALLASLGAGPGDEITEASGRYDSSVLRCHSVSFLSVFPRLTSK